MHHFKSIGEFKLKLQSGNAQFGSKFAIFCPVWPSHLTNDLGKTIGHLFYTTSSFVHHFKAMGEFKLKLQSRNAQFSSKSAIFVLCDIEIWWLTMENNRAPLLYYIKLCASFQSHGWIQTGVTVWKRSIRVKIGKFLSPVTLKIDRWPWKTIGHLFYTTSRFVHHFKSISEVKLELQSGNSQFGSKLVIFCPAWP